MKWPYSVCYKNSGAAEIVEAGAWEKVMHFMLLEWVRILKNGQDLEKLKGMGEVIQSAEE